MTEELRFILNSLYEANVRVITLLKANVSDKRFSHSIRVAETAVYIAYVLGLPYGGVYQASILHDCAKSYSDNELLDLCHKFKYTPDLYEKNNPKILHSKIGAFIAKQKYDINDEEILAAISKHTVGSRQMSLTDSVLYVADYIEPGRKYIKKESHEVDVIVKQSDKKNDIKLFEAVLFVAKSKYKYIKRNNDVMHFETELMIKELEILLNGKR